jgi:hypothetical protein
LSVSYIPFLSERFKLVEERPGMAAAAQRAGELAADPNARAACSERAAAFWKWSEDLTQRIVSAVLAAAPQAVTASRPAA